MSGFFSGPWADQTGFVFYVLAFCFRGKERHSFPSPFLRQERVVSSVETAAKVEFISVDRHSPSAFFNRVFSSQTDLNQKDIPRL